MKTTSTLIICMLTIIASMFATPISAKTIHYVKTDGTGDGSSWANASSSIQTMIDNSASGDEVWVAAGTYYPTTETIARDSRSRTFLVESGVNLYGGFAGNESLISQRALTDLNNDGKVDSCELVNSTILSGDIDGVADVWTKTTNADGTWQWTVTGNTGNCYNVVNTNYIIDGFSIMGGNANTSINSTGGGINGWASKVYNCVVKNCSAQSAGGIYSMKNRNCFILDCSATDKAGGVWSSNSFNCTIKNCSATNKGGGVYSNTTNGTISNYYIFNCSAANGGGIYSYYCPNVYNCIVSNCIAKKGGGVYTYNLENTNMKVQNCDIVNCSATTGSSVYSDYSTYYKNYTIVSNCIQVNNSGDGYSSTISNLFVKPTTFTGVGTTATQLLEVESSDWHLKEGSSYINTGSSTNLSSTILGGTDFDNNPRVLYGTIDIGAYEYVVPIIALPISEDFTNTNTWDGSNLFYSANLNSGSPILWNITNQKAQFSWQTNLTSVYTQPFYTYQIDASKSTKVFLRYDIYFQAYAGSISTLGTEKLNVEYSTDLVTWSTIATYSNANGNIANQTYKHDLSTQLVGKKFFIRFNANGANSNRIEKWEIDNVIIDTDGLSAVNTIPEDKYKYSVNNGVLNIGNLGQSATIQLFDTSGKLLASKSESQTANFMLPMHGVYIVKVTSDAGVDNKKIIW